MERSASVFKYYENKFIHEKMEKIKKKEEKLKKILASPLYNLCKKLFHTHCIHMVPLPDRDK